MARISGRLVDVGLGKETTRGTLVTASKWIAKQNLTLQDKAEVAFDENGLGRLEMMQGADVVKQWAEGSIEGTLRDDTFGLILLALFGSVSDAAHSGETTVYDHTFSVANSNQHQSLSVIIKDANQTIGLALSALESLEIDYALNKYVTYTATFKARKGATTTGTVSYTAENRFRPQDFTAKFATAIAGLGAASAVKIKNLKLKFTKKVEDYQALGNIDLEDLHNTTFGVELTLELMWEDTTYKDYVFNGTKMACSIDLKNLGVSLGVVPTRPQLTFTFAQLAFKDFSKSVPLDDMVTQTITAEALYSLSAASEVTAVLTNTSASY